MNGIEDTNAFANRCATQGFNIVKFGLSPKDNIERENNGIKDIKNERKPKKKKELVTKDEGEQEEERPIGLDGSRTSEENSKPIEKEKDVIVRKIAVIKKNKKND
jgi:hypothetical protein